MPMHDSYVQTHDFNVGTLYIIFLAVVLLTVSVANALIIFSLYRDSLQTSNIPLRILLTVKLISSSLYVLLDSVRTITYLATYNTADPIIIETYVGCGFYYWLTSSAQWMVSFMLTWATLKRILNLRHQRIHEAWICPRISVILVILSLIFAFGLNSHYFLTKSQTVDFTNQPQYGINGTVKICMPEPGSSYMTFWRDVWYIVDALVHIILPAAVLLPVHVAIEIYFMQDEKMLFKMAPRDRLKLIRERKRDKAFITNLGWTRAILYAGLVYAISNLPLNIYLWYSKYEKYHSLLYFNNHSSSGTLFAFELLQYAPHLMWFPIYNLTGCDGRKVIAKKTMSEQALPAGGSYYSLRSRSTEEARARPSRSEETKI